MRTDDNGDGPTGNSATGRRKGSRGRKRRGRPPSAADGKRPRSETAPPWTRERRTRGRRRGRGEKPAAASGDDGMAPAEEPISAAAATDKNGGQHSALSRERDRVTGAASDQTTDEGVAGSARGQRRGREAVHTEEEAVAVDQDAAAGQKAGHPRPRVAAEEAGAATDENSSDASTIEQGEDPPPAAAEGEGPASGDDRGTAVVERKEPPVQAWSVAEGEMVAGGEREGGSAGRGLRSDGGRRRHEGGGGVSGDCASSDSEPRSRRLAATVGRL